MFLNKNCFSNAATAARGECGHSRRGLQRAWAGFTEKRKNRQRPQTAAAATEAETATTAEAETAATTEAETADSRLDEKKQAPGQRQAETSSNTDSTAQRKGGTDAEAKTQHALTDPRANTHTQGTPTHTPL